MIADPKSSLDRIYNIVQRLQECIVEVISTGSPHEKKPNELPFHDFLSPRIAFNMNFSDDVDLNGRGNSLLPRLCSMDVEMMSPGIPLLQTLLYFEADHDFFERHREFLLKLCAAVSRINYDPVPTMRSS
ncbi:hypothetical protein Y032_0109g84 [Ancylostoma ceylanicum]|uniref:Uncharacterized protein n=1 Tax=Ancylostoma ceylanicum TaxID=53326 RepID=A0A016TE47_9BILA|nr:hypothetical protein Y032_0109g84 [Ancylostoma ceylanicum]